MLPDLLGHGPALPDALGATSRRAEVKLQVAPADDESYTEDYRLRTGRWFRKP